MLRRIINRLAGFYRQDVPPLQPSGTVKAFSLYPKEIPSNRPPIKLDGKRHPNFRDNKG